MRKKPILVADKLTVRYGGVLAAHDVSFSLFPGELLGLIGTNGAGKTTLLHLLTGFATPDSGRILLLGRDITRLSPPERASLGIARTFQSIRLFSSMSVLENIQTALSQADIASRHHRSRRHEAVEALLCEYDLTQYTHRRADALPYGIARRVELARAMALSPKLLLLDEPAAGLNPTERNELICRIQKIRQHTPILLIEHDMKLIRCLCSRLLAMDRGKIIASGTPESVLSHPKVISSYLGGARC